MNKHSDKYNKEEDASFYTFDKVFSFEHLLECANLCKRNVYWKTSVINYMLSVFKNVYQTYSELINGKFKFKGTREFDITERGKTRHIKSIQIRERVVQKCLCRFCLHPLFDKTFIYDNGASLPHKGLSFSLNRLKCMLQRHYREFGNNGYVLLFDFSDYFGSISHNKCIEMISKKIEDERLLKLIRECLDVYSEKTVNNEQGEDKVGIGLGSELSQFFALLFANPIDHLIKDKYRFKHYIRYMDDGIIIHSDKTELEFLKDEIYKKAEELGLKLNSKKTKIVKLNHQFTFLKKRISLLDNGKIIMKIDKNSITRMRRKLKKFHKLYLEGKMNFKNIKDSYNSWRSFALSFDAYKSVQSMDRLFYQLFQKPYK